MEEKPEKLEEVLEEVQGEEEEGSGGGGGVGRIIVGAGRRRESGRSW